MIRTVNYAIRESFQTKITVEYLYYNIERFLGPFSVWLVRNHSYEFLEVSMEIE